MRIIGFGVIGPNEKYLEETLREFKRLTDDTMLVLNGEDPRRDQMIKRFGFQYYYDNREWGKEQPRIKSDLLKKLGDLKPDWVLPLDADEVFDPEMTRDDLEHLTRRGEIGFHFYIVNLWNDEEHYHRGLSFWNVRFFQYRPDLGLDYQRKNVHCGLAPGVFYSYGGYAPYFILHRGLMNQGDRQRKVDRYKKYDPRAIYKGREYYDAIAQNPPTAYVDFEEIRSKLRSSPECQSRRIPNVNNEKMPKFFYVRRLKDDKVIDIPEHDLDMTLKKGGFEYVSEIILESTPELPVVSKKSVCAICGFEAKNDFGLKAHKKSHK